MPSQYTKEQAIHLVHESRVIVSRVIDRVVPNSNLPTDWKSLVSNHLHKALWILGNYRSEIEIKHSDNLGIKSFTLSRVGYGEDGLSIEYSEDSQSGNIRELHYYASRDMKSTLLNITMEDGGFGYLSFKDGETKQAFSCFYEIR